MINRVANFEKVSVKQFIKDYKEIFGDEIFPSVLAKYDCKTIDEYLSLIWDNIELPTRSTTKSAGHDFRCPFDIDIYRSHPITIPTGIRCVIEDGWHLQIVPRSSMGFNYEMRLVNTVGVLDGDYYYADNEGHIKAKIDVKHTLKLKRGDKFIQGVFVPYGITVDDDVSVIRTGGIGSTGR